MKINKSMKLYIIIATFIAGVILTVFTYQAVTIYELRTVVAQDHSTVLQVVDFLNKATQGTQAQPAQPQTQAPAPAKK